MSTVMGILKTISACLPFICLLLLVRRCNLSRLIRGRQAAMPVVALVYSAVMIVLILRLGSDPFHLEAMTEKLNEVLLQKLRIPEAKQWVQALSSIVQAVLNFIRSYLTFFTNAVIVLIFFVLKCILLPVFRGIWGENRSLMEVTAGLFYEYDEEARRWFLGERWRDWRKLMRAFYLAVFVIAVAMITLSRQFPEWPVFAVIPYPIFAALLLGEVYFLVGGYTRMEYDEDIMGEDARALRVTNLAKLRDMLRKLFGDRLLLESTELESAAREGVTDLLEELSAQESVVDRITAEYFQILKEDGVRLDVDNIISARNLLAGESVLYCNPFYKDLTQYFLLPMSHTLMNRRKCLVIAGRKSTEPAMRGWMEDALREHLKMSGLWRVGGISEDPSEYEIGILTFSQLYDLEMLSSRRDFFRQVGFVLMLEPSLILATGQVGLSLVVNYCDEAEKRPTYCLCDRNCDGLVDTLSHLIKQSITLVSATETPTCTHTEMCWHSDGDYLHQRIMPDISRYLGVGTELAVAAIKDQVPRVVWRSEKKFPVVDMKWFAGQYYRSICQYANLPVNQESVYQSIGFEADLWGTPREEYSCVIVEDEFCNLLEMARLFLTRAESEAFVNVISEDYLLRGYMQHNYRIFSADGKAIPTIVSDYARTERNATLRLAMLLITNEVVPEDLVEKELRLAGVDWSETDQDCCAALNRLIRKYTTVGSNYTAVIPALRRQRSGLDLGQETVALLRLQDRDGFQALAGPSFRTAYYITEDDKENSSYMDAKLYGHIFQYILPGQFFTYDGRYYEVSSVTPEKGVLVRRAADHIVGRRYYRQNRIYHMEQRNEQSERTRLVNDLEITTCAYDFTVETTGYLEMRASNDLRQAREVRITDSETQNGERANYDRIYRNKNVLRIRLPGATEEVRYTICLLLMELFRTVYAGDWHYLAAVTAQTERTLASLRGVLYAVDGLGDSARGTATVEDDCIYIIEDSDVDMGLLESVDRNLSRLLGIIADFLDWHDEMVHTPDLPDPEPQEVQLPGDGKCGFWQKIKNFFRRIIAFLRRLLHIERDPEKDAKKAELRAEQDAKKAGRKAEKERKKAERKEKKDRQPDADAAGALASEEPQAAEIDPDAPQPVDAAAAREAVNAGDGNPDAGNGGEDSIQMSQAGPDAGECAAEATPDSPGPEITADVGGEDEVSRRHPIPNRYQRQCYLRFGYEGIDSCIAVEETLAYLGGLGLSDNELRRARRGGPVRDAAGQDEGRCDFCGLPLSGVAYDVLADKRVRCVSCSASAIRTVEQFRVLYERILPTMESFYDIRMRMPIRVRTADARVIAKQAGTVYKPTSGFDPRVVGFAKMDKDGFCIYIENGAPRLAAMDTIVHELTHIWQYENWDKRANNKQYGKGRNRDIVYEGMAMWSSIQFLYLIGETGFARRKEREARQRQDVYGEGFRLYCEKYPLSRSPVPPQYTPFHTQPPL